MTKELYPLGLLRPDTRAFIIRFRQKKGYPYSSYIGMHQCLEILKGTSAYHKDTSFAGPLTFDHIIELGQFKIGWDGEDALDMLLYYIESYVKDRIAKTSTML